MKTFVTSILVLSAFAVNAEVVTVKLPGAGTFLVSASKEEGCTPTEYSMAAVEKEAAYLDGKFSYSLNVETKRIINLFGSSMECRVGFNTATGVFVAREAMELNITLVEGLEGSAVTVTEVVTTKPVK